MRQALIDSDGQTVISIRLIDVDENNNPIDLPNDPHVGSAVIIPDDMFCDIGMIWHGGTSFSYHINIDDERDKLWARAKDYREQRKSIGCMTPFGRVQTSLSDRNNINIITTSAIASLMNNDQFDVKFTMEDNSIADLNANDAIQLGSTVAKYVLQCQYSASVIRNQIYSATNLDQLNNIDITSGYPIQ